MTNADLKPWMRCRDKVLKKMLARMRELIAGGIQVQAAARQAHSENNVWNCGGHPVRISVKSLVNKYYLWTANPRIDFSLGFKPHAKTVIPVGLKDKVLRQALRTGKTLPEIFRTLKNPDWNFSERTFCRWFSGLGVRQYCDAHRRLSRVKKDNGRRLSTAMKTAQQARLVLLRGIRK